MDRIKGNLISPESTKYQTFLRYSLITRMLEATFADIKISSEVWVGWQSFLVFLKKKQNSGDK